VASSSSHPALPFTNHCSTSSIVDLFEPSPYQSDETTMSTPSEPPRQPASDLHGDDSNTIKNVAIVGVGTA